MQNSSRRTLLAIIAKYGIVNSVRADDYTVERAIIAGNEKSANH